MSVYLLAWVIGKFDFVESKTNRDTIVRVWATPDKKDQAAFACKVGVKCLEFYEKYVRVIFHSLKALLLFYFFFFFETSLYVHIFG